MAKIDSFNFGFIVVDEKQYAHDVVILPDGTVKERDGERADGKSFHCPQRNRGLTRAQPDIILIGTGVQGWPG